jgi:hypothetical protein
MSISFPGTGHTYLVDFSVFRVELAFTSATSLTYTGIAPDGTREGSETVQIRTEPMSDVIFLVTWQESDKTTVVHIEDFDKKTIVTNITNPDSTFEQYHGTFSEVQKGAAVGPLLSFASDIKPLFRDQDVACMTPRHIPLRDATWMCVPANAERVHRRLADKTMPKDGPWPPERIALFKAWMDQGCRP